MINVYENISPNRNSPRNHKVDRITIHAMSGHMTARACCDMFANPNKKASANYCIGKDGDIAISVPLTDRSWCSSDSKNDNAAVTIEVSSDNKSPYKFDDMAYLVCIDLVVNVMKLYGKNRLVYFGNKYDAENYIIKDNEMLLTKHNFYAPKACPGPWFEGKIPEFINEVHKRLGDNVMDCTAFIEKVANLIKKYNNQFGFCNVSVPLAQCILESGWGGSELAKNANNYFGLKHKDGRCPSACGVYYKIGSEQNPDGSYSSSDMIWEKFDSLESCVKGYYEFLSNSDGRYDNLKGVISPDVYVRLIKDDGYATSLDYVDKILDIINKNELKKYDVLTNNINTISLDKLETIKDECIKTINKIFSEYGV